MTLELEDYFTPDRLYTSARLHTRPGCVAVAPID
jgi:hypothetical protein